VVVSLRDLGVIGPRLQQRGVPVVPLQLGGAVRTLRGLARLWRLLAKEPRDTVVQTWLYHADLLGGTLARWTGHKTVLWNLRGAIERREDFPRATWAVLKLCAGLSSRVPARIVACGPKVLQAHAAHGYDASRGVVIGNGFEPGRFRASIDDRRAVRAELGLREDQLLVGMVARLHPMKDYPCMAAAARYVVERLPQVRFLWVGQGVERDPELSGLVAALGLQDKLVRWEARSDVPRLLAAMDVFCLSSRNEGFPNVVGEAMASGLPCVVTAAGDTEYLLGDSEWVVPPGSPQALGERLVRMLSLPAAARRAIGERNARRVCEEFSISRAWERYFNLYRQLQG
jgi:glycosyltransferase involved in cell wall biosynthesis